MGSAAEMALSLEQIGDIVVESERTGFDGNFDGVSPDEAMNIVAWQHPQDHIAQDR